MTASKNKSGFFGLIKRCSVLLVKFSTQPSYREDACSRFQISWCNLLTLFLVKLFKQFFLLWGVCRGSLLYMKLFQSMGLRKYLVQIDFVDLRGKIKHWSCLLPASLWCSFPSLFAGIHGFEPWGWPSDQLHHRK